MYFAVPVLVIIRRGLPVSISMNRLATLKSIRVNFNDRYFSQAGFYGEPELGSVSYSISLLNSSPLDLLFRPKYFWCKNGELLAAKLESI